MVGEAAWMQEVWVASPMHRPTCVELWTVGNEANSGVPWIIEATAAQSALSMFRDHAEHDAEGRWWLLGRLGSCPSYSLQR